MSTGHSTTPVRLISQNGRFYELACTSVSIDIDRKVMAVPLPASGSTRVTADLNLTNSVITLEGVITDGDAVLSSTGQAASAIIDFSAIAATTELSHSTQFATSIINYTHTYGRFLTSDAYFTDATCDTNHTSGLSDGSSTSVRHITMNSTSKLKVGMEVKGTGIPSGATVASINNATCFTLSADVTATNTNTTLTFGNGTTYVSDANKIDFWRGTVTGGNKDIFKVFFGINDATAGYDTTSSSDEYILSYHDGTSAKTAAEMATGLHNLITNEIPTLNSQIISGRNGANMAVEITFTNVPTGSSYTNDMYFPHATMANYEPRVTTMNKGVEATSTANLSAGDIVQQLYAILSNSQNRWRRTLTGDADRHPSHYIVGLQLPYLSSIDVPIGEKHLSRVMYSTTGLSTHAFQTKSTNFAKFGHTAGTDFDVTDVGVTFTGMKVAVDKATFVQVGGEPNVYSFTILLVATNMIL